MVHTISRSHELPVVFSIPKTYLPHLIKSVASPYLFPLFPVFRSTQESQLTKTFYFFFYVNERFNPSVHSKEGPKLLEVSTGQGLPFERALEVNWVT